MDYKNSIPDILEHFKRGNLVIITDDKNRENEGHLVMAGQFITPELMAFIIHHTGGVVCLALDNALANRLQLPLMVKDNTARYKTAFTVSIDAKEGITTGISAADRSVTTLKVCNPDSKPEDLARPGHIFPVRSHDKGVLARPGHTEASVDFCRICNLTPCAIMSELMNEDGTLMRGETLEAFSKKHKIPILKIEDLIAYRTHAHPQ